MRLRLFVALAIGVLLVSATAEGQIDTPILRPVGYHPSNVAYFNTPLLCERARVRRDDEMIADRYAHHLPRLDQIDREVFVRVRWLRIPGRVIVKDDDGSGVILQCEPEHVAEAPTLT